MDPDMLLQLRRTGSLVELEDGSEGVPVTLQYRGELEGASRAERRGHLRGEFERIAGEAGVTVDPETVSAASQTIEGVLPVDRYDELVKDLRERNVRVDILIDREIT
jgi:hypothetical protein